MQFEMERDLADRDGIVVVAGSRPQSFAGMTVQFTMVGGLIDAQ